MQSNSSWTKKISRFGKISCTFIIFVIEGTFSTLQASDDVPEVLFMRLESARSLDAFAAEDIKKATLHMESKKKEIEFISEKTNFKWDQKEVNFKEEPSKFLEKIENLFLDAKKVKGHSKFNHLCLSLYAVYQEPGEDVFEITESPLFAKKSKKYILSAEGNLIKNSERRVLFYTKTKLLDNDQWAYFTTPDGLASNVKKDPSIFPISSDSYDCDASDAEGCNVVCKEFYHTDGVCPHGDSECRHTEPHILYHVLKHSKRLFSPLIREAGGTSNIKSVGLRFFSYYQSCSSCVDLLSKSRKIEVNADNKFELNYMFYFHNIYLDSPIIKIYDDIIKLGNNNNRYLFRGFLKKDKIYYDNPEKYKKPNKAGDSKGYLKLLSHKELKSNTKIISIYYTGLSKYNIYLCE